MSATVSSLAWSDIFLRLILAIAFGASIGWERESEHKPAGLRTHMLVSLGAALFVLGGLSTQTNPTTMTDSSRVIQGIITGVGFLGAGEIFSKSSRDTAEVRVRGLTSAAAIWISASLGVAAGLGLWFIGSVGALLAFLILWGIKKLE